MVNVFKSRAHNSTAEELDKNAKAFQTPWSSSKYVAFETPSTLRALCNGSKSTQKKLKSVQNKTMKTQPDLGL